MNELGDLLRACREQCEDEPKRRLTLERMAELVGLELGQERLSFQTLNNWELGRARITNRRRLMAVIRVLRSRGGLPQSALADRLLALGDFRPLNPDERRQLFPEEAVAENDAPEPSAPDGRRRLVLFLLGELTFEPSQAVRQLLGQSAGGEPPDWPRLLVGMAGAAARPFSSSRVWRALQWLWVWLLTWWIVLPSLRWPFADREHALAVMGLYCAGAFSLPLFIGALTRTRDSLFWQSNPGVSTPLLRLHTHLGAIMGFHVGYLSLVAVTLAGHYLGQGSSLAWELLGAVVPVALGYLAARVIPYNLWSAYRRLHLAEGGILFVYLFVGPLWAFFFLSYQELLLQPLTGALLILAALSLLAGLMARQYARTGSSIIPIHIWVGVYGLVLILYQASTARSVFAVISLACLIFSLAVLLASNRVKVTLAGALLLLVATTALLGLLAYHLWLGRLTTALLLFAWWRWAKPLIWFPTPFWLVVAAIGAGSIALQYWPAGDVYIALVVGLITIITVADLPHRLNRLSSI